MSGRKETSGHQDVGKKKIHPDRKALGSQALGAQEVAKIKLHL